LETAVLPPVRCGPGEATAALAARVQQAMQDAMHDLTDDRRYLRGRPSSSRTARRQPGDDLTPAAAARSVHRTSSTIKSS
jgi:hypothetical protein